MARIITAGAVVAGLALWTTLTGAGCHIAVLTLARIARSSQTDGAADVGGGTARAIQTGLPRRTADAVADLTAGTARPTHTGLAGIAADTVAAIVRATIRAGTAVVPRRGARAAHSVVANLTGRAAVCAGVTGAKALAVSDTADGRRACLSTIATLKAKPFVVGGITGALAGSRRVGAKDLFTPLGAARISSKNAANAAQTKKAAERGGSDDFKRVTA